MSDFAEEREEEMLEVVSDTSSESEVEMVTISSEDVPLGETIDLSGCSIGGYCPVCGTGISIDISSIPK